MPEPEELSREQMEEQLMAGQYEEPDAEEVPEEALPEEQEETAQVPSLEELQTKLSDLEEQLRQRAGALAEERDRRRLTEGQYAQLMEYIQDARNRAAQQKEEQIQEEYGEYDDYLKAVEARFGPTIRQMAERQAQLEQYVSQQYQIQQQYQQFNQQSQQFVKNKPDYHDAMNFLVERVRQRAGLFYQDPQQRDMVVAQEAQRLINFSPEQLYNLALVDGYQPATKTESTTAESRPPAPHRPKSLAGVPGATGSLPDSWETKAQKAITANLQDLEKIPLEDLDALLKSMK